MKGPVVVVDAANGIGRAVVQAALAQGRPVIAVSQDALALRRLRERHVIAGPDSAQAGIDLTTIIGSLADEAHSIALADKLRDLDRPIAGMVICTCGEPTRGRVLDQPLPLLQRRLEGELLPQLAAARQLLPVLAAEGRNGGYVLIGSPGSEQPWAGYGLRSIAAAALSMLVRVLHMEARPLGVRVQMLAVSRPVQTDDNRERACEGWPGALAIAEQALALVDQSNPQHAANAIVRFEPAREAIPETVLEQTWGALEPLLRAPHQEQRK